MTTQDLTGQDSPTFLRTSAETDKLAVALAAAQGEIEAADKDSENPHFKSRYADLASVWRACRAQLSRAGLAVVQVPTRGSDGALVLVSRLMCGTQWIESVLPIAKAANAQELGATLTYLRRYVLSAMVGVAPDDDDDGESDQGRGNGRREPAPQYPGRQQPPPTRTPQAPPAAKKPEGGAPPPPTPKPAPAPPAGRDPRLDGPPAPPSPDELRAKEARDLLANVEAAGGFPAARTKLAEIAPPAHVLAEVLGELDRMEQLLTELNRPAASESGAVNWPGLLAGAHTYEQLGYVRADMLFAIESGTLGKADAAKLIVDRLCEIIARDEHSPADIFRELAANRLGEVGRDRVRQAIAGRTREPAP